MPRKKQRQPFKLERANATIDNLSHDGRGVAHINGKTTFISNALPGEIVQFQYLNKRSQFDEGQAIDIAQPSPFRQTPRCPHFNVCGGCNLQHLNIEQQRQHKQAVLEELWTHHGQLKPEKWLPTITSEPWGYRRKARLGVQYVRKKERVLIGFRKHQGHLLTDSQQCDVLDPRIGKHIQAFASFIYQLSIRDKIPQLEIAIGDNHCAVIIRHLSAFNEDDLALITQFAKEYQLHIYLQPKGNNSVQLFYPKNTEPLHYQLPQYHLTIEFEPFQFIQINASVNNAMIERAIQLLDCQPHDEILDLFCGIGNFSLPISRHCAHVTGVEGDQNATQQAEKNAEKNKITNCHFHCADLFSPPFNDEWAKRTYDKMLLDPPRSGAEAIIAHINQWKPKRLVYISCNLATLARDSDALNQQGYQLTQAGVMDMFPHTKHIEAIALFEKKSTSKP